jgi:hypothetical protein
MLAIEMVLVYCWYCFEVAAYLLFAGGIIMLGAQLHVVNAVGGTNGYALA